MAHSNTSEKIVELEKTLKKGEMIRVQAATRLQSLEEQFRETNKELQELGVNPEQSQQALEDLNKEIEADFQELEALLPFDTIRDYK